jgi:DNA polymerase
MIRHRSGHQAMIMRKTRGMPVLYRDVETRSTINLAKAGAWRYAADPSTEVLCVGYAVDDGPVDIWIPGQAIPDVFHTAARNADWALVAHNDSFESAIETCLLGPRYGWPDVPIKRHRCTMAMALAAALPGRLDTAAAALGIETRKDAAGHRLMMAMTKPRRPRKGEEPGRIYWHDDPERRRRLADYCRRDVEVERELYKRLPPLSDAEQQLWALDAVINRRGFSVDVKLAKAARAIVRQEQAAIDERVTVLTGGGITSINQVGKLQAFLVERGHDVAGITKRSVAALLAHQPADEIRQLLELRREGAQAAARKLDALLAGADTDHRLRGAFRFHGAATGRWSGSRFQPQNLKKPATVNLDAAIAAVRAGGLEEVRTIGAPLSVVGDLSRNMIAAAPGHVLVGADFSAIESRVLAWLAGEEWKIENYRKFDHSSDPACEPYCVTASRILGRTVTPDDGAGRQIGKTADLALGYGGGLGAWRRFATDDARGDVEVKFTIDTWRKTHPKIVELWYALERAAHRAIDTGAPQECRAFAFTTRRGALLMQLPSGRQIAYPEARLSPGKFENVQITFKDNAKGGFTDRAAWYGTLIENAVQAVSRDLLAAAMQRLEAAGNPVVMHCHDEIVCEVPEPGDVESFTKLMTAVPAWASGLPIAAKGWCRQCYAAAAAQQPPVDDAPIRDNAADRQKLNGHYQDIPLAEITGDGKILCPFHDDTTPSLHIYPDHYHCFACDAHGDHIDWLMMVEGMTRDEAMDVLENWDGSRLAPTEQKTGDMLAAAQCIWNAAKPIAGTLAIRYLKEVRRIDTTVLPDNDALRFNPHCPFDRIQAPCLVAAYRDVASDEFAGIHRIALMPDVFTGAKVQRRTLGSWLAPRAIKLWPAGEQLFLGEGIETTLAAATRLGMRPAWAAGSSSNIKKFPVLAKARLTLLVDNDASGIEAAKIFAQRWRAVGRKVERRRPKRNGADFNDIVLKGKWQWETTKI